MIIIFSVSIVKKVSALSGAVVPAVSSGGASRTADESQSDPGKVSAEKPSVRRPLVRNS